LCDAHAPHVQYPRTFSTDLITLICKKE
jgi:hypothetical protein